MPSHPRDFLSREQAQVWALDRFTGKAVYLPRGQADFMRPRARESLRCPHPDCTVEISTRGGKKRDHFVHMKASGHETGRESEFHLAGKAMVAHWLATVVPDGAVADEEVTIKDPGTALHRRADVMVTGASGRQVAYEVEYKSFAVADWERKQVDYETQQIACLWLIGHTRVRLLGDVTGGPELASVPVVVSALAAEIAAREPRVPLLVINPVTREIGTLAADHRFTSWYRGGDTIAYLRIDDLDDCVFDPHLGIVTPQMRVIARAEQERHQAKAAAEEELRRQEQRWQDSPLRATLVARRDGLPPELSVNAGDPSAVLATVEHWRAVIHEELVHDRTETFGWREIFAALDRHNIRRASATDPVYRAIGLWMVTLRNWGILARFDSHLRLRSFTPTGRTFADVRAAYRAVEERGRAAEARALGRHGASQHGGRMRFADIEPGQSVSDRARTQLVVDSDGTRRWVRKDE